MPLTAHTLYQVSTATALVEGIYEGAIPIATLQMHGDLGLGKFEDLDGEMVIVDGHFFQVRSDGSVREVKAVRLKCNLVHLVWIDGHYDMVGMQEFAKYGRTSGVDFGPADVVTLAEAFGAKGFMIDTPDAISSTLKKALAMQGPVLVGVRVDDADNHNLMEIVHPDAFN